MQTFLTQVYLLVPRSIVRNFLKKSTMELDSALAAFTCPKIESYEGGGATACIRTQIYLSIDRCADNAHRLSRSRSNQPGSETTSNTVDLWSYSKNWCLTEG